ncbi:hypothetical protein FQN60_012560 [Etheostoma spectabile]|uniref:Uncharacterized protein n=1 Tax=Etheostoma spectabile TaxID=54343 RepID=A0A5J5DPZ0_9PERO|nr:hypothetical protein FQN60_012560 [Etheostoma spectabile]
MYTHLCVPLPPLCSVVSCWVSITATGQIH